MINPARESTSDVDGWVGKPVDATEVVRQLQTRWGLEADWFNFRAEGLLPPVAGQDMFSEAIRSGDVTLYVARPEALLAMKLFAARSRDQDDIAFLLRFCEVGSVAEADDVLGRYYPGDALSDTALARVKAALAL